MITQTAFGGVHSISFCGKCGRPLSNPVSVKIGIGSICRGHSKPEEANMPRVANVNWNDWGIRFDYEGYHGCASHCRLLIQGNTVLCTEAWDNEGTSITNMAEDIATLVCRQRNIPMEKLVWIEHYIHDEFRGLEHRFDHVEFKISDEPHFGIGDGGQYLRHPKWRFLNPEDAEKMIGLPLSIPHSTQEEA